MNKDHSAISPSLREESDSPNAAGDSSRPVVVMDHRARSKGFRRVLAFEQRAVRRPHKISAGSSVSGR